MKDYEDEAFDELEKKLQKQVATGVTDGSLWRKRQNLEAQRPWIGLTDGDIKAVNAQVSQIPPIDYTTTTYAKAIEDKLKEKNNIT